MGTQVTATGKFSPALPVECKPITYRVFGKVTSARSGKQIRGAKVTVVGTDISSPTGGAGNFRLRGVTPGNITLLYEKDGFEEAEVNLLVTADVPIGGAADISLTPKLKE